MTYGVLNLIFLGVVLLVVLAAAVTRRSPKWRAVGLTAVVLLLMTAVFDNLMISSGLVAYDAELLSGVMIGVAPIEDFAYTVAAVLILPSVWSLTQRRARG